MKKSMAIRNAMITAIPIFSPIDESLTIWTVMNIADRNAEKILIATQCTSFCFQQDLVNAL